MRQNGQALFQGTKRFIVSALSRFHFAPLALFLTYLFNYVTPIIVDPARLYIGHSGYHAQVRAFIYGQLVIQDNPWTRFSDSTWGMGLNQPWGLGIPLLMWPFEYVARLIGIPGGVPDRAFMLVAVFLTIWFLLWVVDQFLKLLRDNQVSYSHLLVMLSAVLLLVFSRPMRVVVLACVTIYEQSSLMSFLWSIAGFIALLAIILKPSRFNLLLISFFLGFGVLLRPTMIFYSIFFFLALFTIQVLSNQQWRRRDYVSSLILFVLPIGFQLLTNWLRFGGPNEWGYSTNISSNPIIDMWLRFDFPYRVEKFWPAARELFGTLFFMNYAEPCSQVSTGLWFQSTLPRERCAYTATFTVFFLILFAVSTFFAWIALKRNVIKFESNLQRSLSILFVSLLGVSAALFIFYLRAPIISSRYMVDFSTAITGVILLAMFLVYRWVPSKFLSGFSTLVFAFFVWLQFFESTGLVGLQFDNDKKNRIGITGIEMEHWLSYLFFDESSLSQVSNPMECGPGKMRFPLWTYGWNSSNCRVGVVTSVFVPYAKCIKIKLLARSNSQAHLPVMVKLGKEVATQRWVTSSGDHFTKVFCTDELPIARRVLRDPKFELLSLAWVDPLSTNLIPPDLELVEVSSASSFQ